jgi:collagenase-like PrtC family protease
MGVKFWQKIGLTRVILSRELSLDEVAQIRDLCPDMEIEVFVHGALCIAYSGRCLLSGLFQSPRSESGHVYQFLPLGLQSHGRVKKMTSGDIQDRPERLISISATRCNSRSKPR